MNMMSSMATPAKHLTVFEEDALALTQAALEISRAYESKDERRLFVAETVSPIFTIPADIAFTNGFVL